MANNDESEQEELITYCAKMLNCNGLNERVKRNKIITELQIGQPDILILVDSRLADCDLTMKKIARMDSYRYELAGESSQSKGIAVLLKNTTNLKLVRTHK